MDNLESALGSILSDAGSMDKIKELAAGLMGSKETKQPEPVNNLSSMMSDAQNMSKLLKVMSALGNNTTDRRGELLLALKPHLSPERAERVDRAVKILRLLSVAPLLADSGILF